jgi:hypothetical protein
MAISLQVKIEREKKSMSGMIVRKTQACLSLRAALLSGIPKILEYI